jgi:hypothetical protein
MGVGRSPNEVRGEADFGENRRNRKMIDGRAALRRGHSGLARRVARCRRDDDAPDHGDRIGGLGE